MSLSHIDEKNILSILDNILKNKLSSIFQFPVDVKGLNLYDYYDIIKKPMDLSTIRNNIYNKIYKEPYQALDDIQLIWDNCKTYNIEGSDIHNDALKMEKYADRIIKKIYKKYKKKTFQPYNIIDMYILFIQF